MCSWRLLRRLQSMCSSSWRLLRRLWGMRCSLNKESMNATQRKRLHRERNREDPDRKKRRLTVVYMFDHVEISILIDKNKNVWFKVADIAKALHLADPSKNLKKRLRHEPDKCSFKHLRDHGLCCDIYDMHPKTMFITEGAMYRFVMRSNVPRAIQFQEWITEEVLPAICKNNAYSIPKAENPLGDYQLTNVPELIDHPMVPAGPADH